MVVNCLGKLVEKVRVQVVIDGFRIGKDRVEVSHLQFVDDTIFFLLGDECKFNNLVKLLSVFCSLSGLKLNLTKSKLAGVNMEVEKLVEWTTKLGCVIKN